MWQWKETVTNISEPVFPGISHFNSKQFTKNVNAFGDDTVINLPLQMALYFNVVFFPVWVIVMLLLLPVKLECIPELYKLIVIITVTAVFVNESIRIYLGYVGNLTEKIPELAAFWMLSVLQLPMQLFLLIKHPVHFSSVLEVVVQSIMVIFLMTELVAGFITLKHSAKHSAQKFQLAQFKIDDTSSVEERREKVE